MRLEVQPDNAAWTAENRTPITTGILLPETGIAITIDDNGWMRASDIVTGKLVSERPAHDRAVWSVSSDANESLLATVGEDQQLRCWELPSLALRFEAQVDWGVRDVCVAPDASWVASAPATMTVGETGSQREGTI